MGNQWNGWLEKERGERKREGWTDKNSVQGRTERERRERKTRCEDGLMRKRGWMDCCRTERHAVAHQARVLFSLVAQWPMVPAASCCLMPV